MDSRAVELLNLELDGRLDAAARAELDARLAAEPALQTHRAQLHAVAQTLAAAPAPDLPPGFAERVLLRAGLPARPRRAPRRYARAGLALAASVVVAVVVLRFVEQESAREHLAATLAPAGPTVAVTPRDDGLALAFELPAGPGDLVVEFDGAGLLSAKADHGGPARIAGRRIVVAGVGPGRTTLVVTGDVGDFKASLVRDGAVTGVTLQPH